MGQIPCKAAVRRLRRPSSSPRSHRASALSRRIISEFPSAIRSKSIDAPCAYRYIPEGSHRAESPGDKNGSACRRIRCAKVYSDCPSLWPFSLRARSCRQRSNDGTRLRIRNPRVGSRRSPTRTAIRCLCVRTRLIRTRRLSTWKSRESIAARHGGRTVPLRLPTTRWRSAPNR